MKRTVIAVILSIVMFGSGLTGYAAEESSKNKAAPAEKKAKQMPFRGKVGSVDKVAKTVTLEGREKSRTLQITSATKITREGKPALLDDVVVGESVGGLARENAAGKMEVVTLNIGAKPGKAKPGDKKEKN